MLLFELLKGVKVVWIRPRRRVLLLMLLRRVDVVRLRMALLKELMIVLRLHLRGLRVLLVRRWLRVCAEATYTGLVGVGAELVFARVTTPVALVDADSGD